MIYTTLISCFATFSYGRSSFFRSSVLVSCITLGITITAVYHYLHNPLFHQNAFALLLIVLLLNSIYLMETRVKFTNPRARLVMWQMLGWGSAVFLSAFGLWNVDNVFCTDLRRMRRIVGMPWGFILGTQTTFGPFLNKSSSPPLFSSSFSHSHPLEFFKRSYEFIF